LGLLMESLGLEKGTEVKDRHKIVRIKFDRVLEKEPRLLDPSRLQQLLRQRVVSARVGWCHFDGLARLRESFLVGVGNCQACRRLQIARRVPGVGVNRAPGHGESVLDQLPRPENGRGRGQRLRVALIEGERSLDGLEGLLESARLMQDQRKCTPGGYRPLSWR